MRSLTATLLPISPDPWHRGADALGDVVPSRPAARRQSGAARGLCRRSRPPALRGRPRALGALGGGPPRVPHGLPGRASTGPSTTWAGPLRSAPATRSSGSWRPHRRLAPPSCTWPPTTVPTAGAATGGGAGARRARRRAGPHRLAVRRRAGPGAEATRVSPTRCSRPSPRPGPSTAGAAPVDATRVGRMGDASTGAEPVPTAEAPDGVDLPEAGEAAALRRWAAFLEDAGRRLRRGARPTGPRRHLADVGPPEVGRDPPPDDAGRPGPAAGARGPRASATSSPGGSSTPTCSGTGRDSARDYLRPEYADMDYDAPG